MEPAFAPFTPLPGRHLPSPSPAPFKCALTPHTPTPLVSALAAFSLLLCPAGAAPVSAAATSKLYPAAAASASHFSRTAAAPQRAELALLITPAQPDTQDSDHSPPTNGALLRVEPKPAALDAASPPDESAPSRSAPRSRSTAKYPPSSSAAGAAGTLREWTRPPRTVLASERLFRLRPRVRPATLGLVGVGAFTSGSVFLRTLTLTQGRKAAARRRVGGEGLAGLCSVVCMQIPFCVPERARLLEGLAILAETANLTSADGMAAAAREVATLLMEEEGLLVDSSKFAPHMDVFMAENLRAAERRFSGHVLTEGQRAKRISTKAVEYDVSPRAKLGQYGVITLVVATMEGVDLGCHGGRGAEIERLKRALESMRGLGEGEAAGLELVWIPSEREARSLTRAQLSDAFPCLRAT